MEEFFEGELYVFTSKRLCSFKEGSRVFTVAMAVEVLVLPARVYICDPAIYFTSLLFCLKVPLVVLENAPGVTTMKDLLQTDTCVCFFRDLRRRSSIHPTTDFCDLKNISTS
jgi:hypothetical protein